jgi:5-methyltetrahydropteroyltriglutamate--homocysteine methyltransferase
MPRVAAYQHGIYPRSEEVVAATRGLERGRNSPEEVELAYRGDRQDFIRVQQEAGLDFVSDGLLKWQDIFRPLVGLSGGLSARTMVRWFDNNSFFRAPELTADLTITAPVPAQMEGDDDLPPSKLATLPSPYLFSRATQTSDDRNAVMMDLTREVLRPVAQALVERGYGLIHLEEPWLVYHPLDPSDWDDFEKAVGEIREATGGATLVLHTYFGDAGPLADRLRNLPVDAVGVDLIETDPATLGTRWQTGLLAGALDGRRSLLESPEAVAGFVRDVAERLQPTTVFVSSNCELEFLSRDLARRKVALLGDVSARLKEALT